mmetsp:Transcript_59831/g.68774  ORF Transcript_59831/g.68774 Transcript_59831/m.68774 type:complete len:98 (+) Transcript_59831:123-416(+)
MTRRNDEGTSKEAQRRWHRGQRQLYLGWIRFNDMDQCIIMNNEWNLNTQERTEEKQFVSITYHTQPDVSSLEAVVAVAISPPATDTNSSSGCDCDLW